jgi:hypothetical protein
MLWEKVNIDSFIRHGELTCLYHWMTASYDLKAGIIDEIRLDIAW